MSDELAQHFHGGDVRTMDAKLLVVGASWFQYRAETVLDGDRQQRAFAAADALLAAAVRRLDQLPAGDGDRDELELSLRRRWAGVRGRSIGWQAAVEVLAQSTGAAQDEHLGRVALAVCEHIAAPRFAQMDPSARRVWVWHLERWLSTRDLRSSAADWIERAFEVAPDEAGEMLEREDGRALEAFSRHPAAAPPDALARLLDARLISWRHRAGRLGDLEVEGGLPVALRRTEELLVERVRTAPAIGAVIAHAWTAAARQQGLLRSVVERHPDATLSHALVACDELDGATSALLSGRPAAEVDRRIDRAVAAMRQALDRCEGSETEQTALLKDFVARPLVGLSPEIGLERWSVAVAGITRACEELAVPVPLDLIEQYAEAVIADGAPQLDDDVGAMSDWGALESDIASLSDSMGDARAPSAAALSDDDVARFLRARAAGRVELGEQAAFLLYCAVVDRVGTPAEEALERLLDATVDPNGVPLHHWRLVLDLVRLEQAGGAQPQELAHRTIRSFVDAEVAGQPHLANDQPLQTIVEACARHLADVPAAIVAQLNRSLPRGHVDPAGVARLASDLSELLGAPTVGLAQLVQDPVPSLVDPDAVWAAAHDLVRRAARDDATVVERYRAALLGDAVRRGVPQGVARWAQFSGQEDGAPTAGRATERSQAQQERQMALLGKRYGHAVLHLLADRTATVGDAWDLGAGLAHNGAQLPDPVLSLPDVEFSSGGAPRQAFRRRSVRLWGDQDRPTTRPVRGGDGAQLPPARGIRPTGRGDGPGPHHL